jgi:Fe-S-cluster-containing dehydrogenase component
VGNALKFSPGGGAVRVDDRLCAGCGLCLAACPSEALSLRQVPVRYEARRVHRHVINPRP